MKKLLLTGFDPFAHYLINPSWEAVRSLPASVAGLELHRLLLPNIYGLGARMLLEKAAELQPDIILMTGMNSGSPKLELNLAALNIRDALIEDNLGHKPWNQPILADGPAAYFATLPVHELYQRLHAQGFPLRLAYASGGYVCNDIFYLAAHAYRGTRVQVGFVHVPLLPEMVFDEALALPLSETQRVLVALLTALSELSSTADE